MLRKYLNNTTLREVYLTDKVAEIVLRNNPNALTQLGLETYTYVGGAYRSNTPAPAPATAAPSKASVKNLNLKENEG